MTTDPALRERLAALYGTTPQCVLPVRGWWHAVELLLRRGAMDGAKSVSASASVAGLARFYGLTLGSDCAAARVVMNAAAPEEELVLIDAQNAEYDDFSAPTNALVVRSLGAYGVDLGVIVASERTVARLDEVLGPENLPGALVAEAVRALKPAALRTALARIAFEKSERRRIVEALTGASNVRDTREGPGFAIEVDVIAKVDAERQLRLFGIDAEWRNATAQVRLGDTERNAAIIAVFGVATERASGRVATVTRETAETKISVSVDLDSAAPPVVSTGVAFFDHMLAQVALHGGFSLSLDCDGDLEVDAHHTIEDCALALGQALKEALGARRGIARYGFVLPMDEAEAKISIDLGGRPYLVFEGAFRAPLLGAYATEMTEHVFRSLSQSLGAAIHVSVTGENDHHKTEACFKAFGRALRQAVRVEGTVLPSTKGVIA